MSEPTITPEEISLVQTEIASQVASLRASLIELTEKNITWDLLDSGTMDTEIRLTQGDYSRDIMTSPDFADLDTQVAEETGVDREKVRHILEHDISEDLLHDLRVFSAVEIASHCTEEEDWTPTLAEKPAHLKKWEDAQNYMGQQYYEYYVILGKTRDSEAVDRSNFDSLEERLKDPDNPTGEYKPGVVVPRFRHWACGWIEAIMVHETAIELLEEMEEIVGELKDHYPILDETLFSEYEVEDNTYWCSVCNKDTYHPEYDKCDECEQRKEEEARKKEEEGTRKCSMCGKDISDQPDSRVNCDECDDKMHSAFLSTEEDNAGQDRRNL